MTEKLAVGSLFSGIGGLELGLERTGGFRTVWQCEIEPYCYAVLKRHWPGVPNLGDITKVDWNGVEKPDLICGGFPCQDISWAGKGAGIGIELNEKSIAYAKKRLNWKQGLGIEYHGGFAA